MLFLLLLFSSSSSSKIKSYKLLSNLQGEIWSLSLAIGFNPVFVLRLKSFLWIRPGFETSKLKDVLTKTPCIEKDCVTENICFLHYRPNQIDKNQWLHIIFTCVFCVWVNSAKKEKLKEKRLLFVSCFNQEKTEKILIRTWLLPQNFKAHKATKREKNCLVFWNLRCYIEWMQNKKSESMWDDWVTFLMRDLRYEILLNTVFWSSDIWWKVLR